MGLLCLPRSSAVARMGVKWKVLVKCCKCDVGLCVMRSYFEEYHNKAELNNEAEPPREKLGLQTKL